MRRAGLLFLLLACALSGALAASVLAGASPASIFTTSSGATTTATVTTTTTASTTAPTTTVATTTTAPTTTTRPVTTFPTTTTTRPVTTFPTTTTRPVTTFPTTTTRPVITRPVTTTRTTPKPVRPKRPAPKRPAPKPVVKIEGRVSVGGVPVGGLTPAVARSRVRRTFATPLVVRANGRLFRPTAASLGARAYVNGAVARARAARPGTAVALVVKVRGDRVRTFVGRLAERFERSAVDSELVLRGLQPYLTADRTGQALDRVAATSAVLTALVENSRRAIRLDVKPVPPAVTREAYGSVVVIRRGSNQLQLFDGMEMRQSFRVATGEARYPTPLGRFSIVVKWRHPWWYPPDSEWARGKKPVPPGPGNPLGTRWMGISAPGVGIHGTPDPGSIGYSVSHGCIRMQIPEAEWLFEQISIGTPVFIVSA